MSGVFKACHGCTERYIGCHGKCEKYLGEKAEWERMKARANEGRESKLYIAESIVRRQSQAAIRKKKNSQYQRKRWE